MLEMILYGVGFFLVTIGIQAFLHKVRKNGNMGQTGIWTGMVTILSICVIGIIMEKLALFAGVIGFAIADEVGKKIGWHD